MFAVVMFLILPSEPITDDFQTCVLSGRTGSVWFPILCFLFLLGLFLLSLWIFISGIGKLLTVVGIICPFANANFSATSA